MLSKCEDHLLVASQRDSVSLLNKACDAGQDTWSQVSWASCFVVLALFFSAYSKLFWAPTMFSAFQILQQSGCMEVHRHPGPPEVLLNAAAAAPGLLRATSSCALISHDRGTTVSLWVPFWDGCAHEDDFRSKRQVGEAFRGHLGQPKVRITAHSNQIPQELVWSCFKNQPRQIPPCPWTTSYSAQSLSVCFFPSITAN